MKKLSELNELQSNNYKILKNELFNCINYVLTKNKKKNVHKINILVHYK